LGLSKIVKNLEAGMTELKSLLSPIRIRKLEIPNRAVMPPMGTALAERGGMVSEALLAYMRRMAAGGVGLLISEITAVHPTAAVTPNEVGSWDDRFIPGLKKLAEVMHSGGSKAALQLHHTGRESLYQIKKGQALGPSAAPSLVYGQAAKEMTLEQIQEIIAAFGAAAGRAQEAGFDAVEIHGAHGYLLTQFLSAISNHRTDEYGGSFANRARFTIEVVREIRKRVGPDFPVLLRISAEEFIKGGYMVEDVLTIMPDLMAAGMDVLHASLGTHGSPAGITSAPPEYEPGFNVWRAEKIKERFKIPVIAVGRFNDPRQADEVIAAGRADMVSFGRQQLCDPDYLLKARTGRFDEIRKCIACNQGCIEREMYEGKSVRCAINPETGQELLYPRSKTKNPKKVWIIGAGPAGLIAAQEAQRLGHQVSLFEKESRSGGNILYACKAPHKEIYLDWIDWLTRQVEKSGVTIQTGKTVTAEMVAAGKPEAVVLCVGGEKITPSIPGIKGANVFDAWQILGEEVAPGKNALVVGGGLIGMETACFLAARGCAVTLIEQLPSSPVLKATSHGYSLHKYLREKQCVLRFGCALKSLQPGSVTLAVDGKEEKLAGFDQVVIAVGMRPRNDLKAYLEQNNVQHTIVGDALKVRRIMEATEEGAKAAWEL
jgi:2,4-dienoyl-CoA reductase-like NADH-dependent reductase (Old Yellow Enzyme family)/thioredoxin reductase